MSDKIKVIAETGTDINERFDFCVAVSFRHYNEKANLFLQSVSREYCAYDDLPLCVEHIRNKMELLSVDSYKITAEIKKK